MAKAAATNALADVIYLWAAGVRCYWIAEAGLLDKSSPPEEIETHRERLRSALEFGRQLEPSIKTIDQAALAKFGVVS